MLDAMGKRWGKNRQFAWRKESDSGSSRAGTFTIEHWNDNELITYSTEDFPERNLNLVPSDLVELLGGKAIPSMNTASKRTSGRRQNIKDDSGGNTIIGGSSSSFVRELFANEVLAAAASERATMAGSLGASSNSEDTDKTVGGLGVPGAKAARKPSMRRKASTKKATGEEDGNAGLARGATLARKNTVAARRAEMLSQRCVMGTLNTSLNDLFETLTESCRMFYLLCLTPYNSSSHDSVSARQSGFAGIDSRYLKSQIKALQLNMIRDKCASAPLWVVDMEYKEFWDRYSVIERWQNDLVKRAAALMWKDKMIAVKEEMEWTELEFSIGKDRVSYNRMWPALVRLTFQ